MGVKNYIKKAIITFGFHAYKLTNMKINEEIVFFFPYYHIGGSERVHLDIVKYTQITKPLVIFTCKSEDNHFLEDFQKYGKILDLSYFGNLSIIRLFLSGFFANMINHSDVKVIFGANNLLFYEMVPLVQNVKIVDLMHSFGSGIETDSIQAVPYLNQRIVIDRNTIDDFKQQYHKYNIDKKYLSKIQLIENAVKIGNNNKTYDNSLNILYIGRGVPEKRVYLIGKIAKRCKQMNLNVSIKLIGDVLESVNEEDRIFCEFLGAKKEVYPFYQEAHLLLLTSEREGFPMVIMEGMANGVIPITTDVGGIRYHIENESNGYLITNSNEKQIVDDIVDRIKILEHNRSLAQEVSNEAFSYAKKYFSHDAFQKKYMKLLND